ncbi:MAG: PilZ domain-containing protein [Myxococcota bacterium]
MSNGSERRDGPRIDLRLRVRWSAAGGTVSGEAEASDVSPRGLRIESEHRVDEGAELIVVIDAGDEESLEARGAVTWCKTRSSPLGRTLYDLGVQFDTDWLAQKRGPLGSALARVFAMNSVEPARGFDRTRVSWKVLSSGTGAEDAEVVDLSQGGMQLRSSGGFGEGLCTGGLMTIGFTTAEATQSLRGRVVWSAKEAGGAASLGVQFLDTTDEGRTFVEDIRTGTRLPTQIQVMID